MTTTKYRTLFYRRASWTGSSNNLQKLLKPAFDELTTTAERTFSYGEGEIQGLAIFEGGKHLFLHVAYYVPNQPTSLVPAPSVEKTKDTSQQPPPDAHNYMEGDIFVLINGNNIVLCPSGASEAVAVSFINQTLRKIGKKDLIPILSIEPIADVDKVKLLRQEGVKKVSLESSLYEATEEYTERTTTKMKLMNSIAQELLALFAKDKNKSLQDIQEAENLMVRLEISYDARRKGGEVGRTRIEKTANKLISDDEDQGFKIVTGSGKTLTATQIRVSEKIKLAAHGKSVMRKAAWEKLAEYFDELKTSGILEQ